MCPQSAYIFWTSALKPSIQFELKLQNKVRILVRIGIVLKVSQFFLKKNCIKMKYNGCDKNLTKILNYVKVMIVYTTATYSNLSSIFNVDKGGQFWAAILLPLLYGIIV